MKFARFEPNEEELHRLHDAALRLIDETQYDRIEPVALNGPADSSGPMVPPHPDALPRRGEGEIVANR